MILTVVIGNTNTEFGWFDGHRLVRSIRARTGSLRSTGIPRPGGVTGVAIASVVAEATKVACAGLRASGLKPYLVGPRTRTGLRFRYRRTDLGADRLCAAAGASRRFPDQDLIVFDFGTATTVNVILREGVFAGGAILPGIRMSFDALADNTAGLPRLVPGEPRSPIQHGTRAAMQAGVAGLFAGGIDRIIDEVERDTGRSHRVVATGGGTRTACRYTKRIGTWIPRLASEGLAEVFYFNNPASEGVRSKARTRTGNPRT